MSEETTRIMRLFLIAMCCTFFVFTKAGANDQGDDYLFFYRQSTILLKPGQISVEQNFFYQRRERQFMQSYENAYQFGGSMFVQLGILDSMELFFGMPVIFMREEKLTESSFAYREASGNGDMDLGVKFQVWDEGRGCIDAVVSTSFSIPFGSNPYNNVLGTGSGHYEFDLSLSLVKSIDPIIFFWEFGHVWIFEKRYMERNIKPGNQLGYGFGFGLALSSDFTVNWQIGGNYSFDAEIDSQTIPRSDQEVLMLKSGISCKISNSIFIEPSVSHGLSLDSPDYVISISVNWRFAI